MPIILSFATIGSLGLCGAFRGLVLWSRLNLLYIYFFIYMSTIVALYVLSRYRVQITPILLLFGSYFIISSFKDLWRRHFSKVAISVVALLFSFFIVNFNFLFAKSYPIFFKESLSHKDGKTYIIRDNNGEYHGEEMAILSNPTESIKKELYVKENLFSSKKEIKEVGISFRFAAAGQRSQLLVFFNNKLIGVSNFSDTGGMINSFSSSSDKSINKLLKKLLKKGKNTIELVLLSATPGSYVIIPKDNLYNFGRSFYRRDPSSDWQQQKGEYMIELRVKKRV
jgi:hypothetical protein